MEWHMDEQCRVGGTFNLLNLMNVWVFTCYGIFLFLRNSINLKNQKFNFDLSRSENKICAKIGWTKTGGTQKYSHNIYASIISNNSNLERTLTCVDQKLG